MVDRVFELEPGKRIKTLKNVTGNDIDFHFLGHFPICDHARDFFHRSHRAKCFPTLFTHTTGKGVNPREFMALAAVNGMRFLVPVLPGDTMAMEITSSKMTEEAALVEGVARVEDTVVARGKLSFARKIVEYAHQP